MQIHCLEPNYLYAEISKRQLFVDNCFNARLCIVWHTLKNAWEPTGSEINGLPHYHFSYLPKMLSIFGVRLFEGHDLKAKHGVPLTIVMVLLSF